MSRNKKNWDQLVDRFGNYAINISEGLWPGSELDSQGAQGEKGEPGKDGGRGAQGEKGFKGDKGFQGDQGLQGEDGKANTNLPLSMALLELKLSGLSPLKVKKATKANRVIVPTTFGFSQATRVLRQTTSSH